MSSPGPDSGGRGSSWPSIRSSKASEAQTCSRVPSTEKCSSLKSGLTSGAHQLLKEVPHDLDIEESLAALVTPARSACGRCKDERGGMPDRIIRTQPHIPAELEVVVQLLQQQALLANPVESLQQRGQQQLFREHIGPSFCGIQLTEGGIEATKDLMGQFPDPPQWMTGRNPNLN